MSRPQLYRCYPDTLPYRTAQPTQRKLGRGLRAVVFPCRKNQSRFWPALLCPSANVLPKEGSPLWLRACLATDVVAPAAGFRNCLGTGRREPFVKRAGQNPPQETISWAFVNKFFVQAAQQTLPRNGYKKRAAGSTGLAGVANFAKAFWAVGCKTVG